MSKRRIVVVGGGAGGLELASRLGRSSDGSVAVTLVDARTAHFWKPLLHQVASGALDSHLDEISFLGQSARSGFRYEFGNLMGLDRNARRIHLAAAKDPDSDEIALPERSLSYDDLIIAVGSEVNDFGIPGVRDHAHLLDTREQAQRLRRRLVVRLAQIQADPTRAPVKIVIVGAGATGVELAAELVETARVLKRYSREEVANRILDVTILETAPRILSGVNQKVAERTAKALGELGVKIKTECKVVEVAKDRVSVESGKPVASDLTVWAAGVRGPAVLSELGLKVGRGGRLLVDPTLRCQGETQIHALGDCALCEHDGKGQEVPPRAQAASQQARYLAERLRVLAEARHNKPFVYKDKGTLVSLASFTAFGKLGSGDSNFISGDFARLAYASLRRSHQATLLGLPRTAAIMLSDWLRKPVRPPLKLT